MTQLLFYTLMIGICSAATPEQFDATCGRANAARCCTKKPPTMENYGVECSKSSKTDLEFIICVSNKSGFVTKDGEVDFDKALKFYENNYPEYSDSVEVRKEMCTAERLIDYRLGDNPSNLLELQKCVFVQMVFRCPEWNDGDECAGVAEKAAKCLELFS